MFEALFYSWQQLPFACSYAPGQRPVMTILGKYLGAIFVGAPPLAVLIATYSQLPATFAIIGVAFGFIRQYRLLHRGGASASATNVQLPPGAHIVSSSTDSGKLVLHVTTPTRSEVDIFDLASGQRIQQIKDGAP